METTITRRTQLSILAVALLSFVGILIETSMNVTFPTLIKQLHVSLATVQWLTTGYLLLVTIVMGTTAYLLKRFDARLIFRSAVLCNLLGTLLCATATVFPVLLLGRLLQAISTGLSTPLMFEITFSKVPGSQIGTYTGLAEMMISLAPALGPTYGGLLAEYLSWRWIFWVVLPIVLLVALLGEATIRATASHRYGTFDVLGLCILSSFFTGLVWTFNEAGNHGFGSGAFLVWLAISVALLGLQVWHIRYGKHQLLDWSILKSPVLSLRLLSYFLLQFINIGASFVIPLYIEDALGRSTSVAGLILFPGAMIGALIAPLAGRLFDQHGLRRLIIFSNVFVVLGALLFTLLAAKLSLAMIALFFVIIRIGFNCGFGNSMSEASQLVAVNNKADQNSLFNMLQQYSGSLGTGVLSAFISAAGLTISSTAKATIRGSELAFGLLLILALISLGTSVVANHLQGATSQQ